MKKSVMLLLASTISLSASSAIAEPGEWYIGIGAGYSFYNDWVSEADITAFKNEFGAGLGAVNFDGTQSADSEDTAFGYKLFGGYSFYKNFAVELSYIDMGEVEANSRSSGTFYDAADNSLDGDLYATARANVNAFTLDIKLDIPITSFAVVMIKGGAYSADTELNITAGGSISPENYSSSKTERSTDIHYGLGINFRITDNIGLRAEWERLDNVEANGGKNDVDLLSAGLVYGF